MRASFISLPPSMPASWFWLIPAGVVVAPLSSKLAGALWLLLCLTGVWATFRETAPPGALRDAALTWLQACGVAIIAALVARVVWHEAWDELHAPLRLLLAAMAGLALAGWLGSNQPRNTWLAHALALACCGAAVLASWRFESRIFPTNAIAWAVSVSFFVCLLVPHMQKPASYGHRIFWGLGVSAGVLAVLLSQSRGAYGLLIWVIFFGARVVWKHCTSRAARSGLVLAMVAMASCIVAAALLSNTLGSKLEQGVQELAKATTGPQTKQSADSSVGGRIYLWRIAAEGFSESPLIGIGGQDRLRRIRETGERLDSPSMRDLGHMHNEYFQAAVDYGLLGLASTLTLVFGLAVSAVRLGQVDNIAGWQLGGIAFMHATAGLTNVNTAHNYYGAMLATTVLLAFMSARMPDKATR